MHCFLQFIRTRQAIVDNQILQIFPPGTRIQNPILSHLAHPSMLEKSFRNLRDQLSDSVSLQNIVGSDTGASHEQSDTVRYPIMGVHTASPTVYFSDTEISQDSIITDISHLSQAHLATASVTRLCFGDVDVKTTLMRTWGVLNLMQKLKMAWNLVSGRCVLFI